MLFRWSDLYVYAEAALFWWEDNRSRIYNLFLWMCVLSVMTLPFVCSFLIGRSCQ